MENDGKILVGVKSSLVEASARGELWNCLKVSWVVVVCVELLVFSENARLCSFDS